MNEASIELLLRERLSVEDEVIARVREAVRERWSARARPRRIGWIALAAAACAVAVAGAWWALRAPSRDDVRAIHMRIVRGANERDAAGDESARRLGLLMNHADAIASARVVRVAPTEVELELLELVRGAVKGELRIAPSGAEFGCTDATTWTQGETCLLFLGRNPDTLRFEPLFGGAGKLELPVDGLFELEDVVRLERERSLAPERVARWIRERGAASLHFVTSHVQELERVNVPLGDDVVQHALVETIARGAADDKQREDLVVASMHVESARLKSLDTAAVARVRAAWDRVHGGVNAEFDAPRVLRPWVELGDAWAMDELRKQADIWDARWMTPGKVPGSIDLVVELYGLLLRVDPTDARRRAWSVYERLPAHGWPDAGHMLEHLLAWDPDRAEKEIVARATEQWKAKRWLWLDTLARAHSPAARKLLREILASDALVPGVAAAFHDLERLASDRKHAPELADVRDVLQKRAMRTNVAFGTWKTWFELYVRSGGDPRAANEAVQFWKTAALSDEDSLALFRLLERTFGVRLLPYDRPTHAEWESMRMLHGIGYVDER